VHGGGRPVHDVGGKEVTAMDTTAMEWEPPEFEEVGTSAEVTAYAGRWDDDRPWD
jgi:coenzyme PQQ precursor peptide PqqA